MSNKLEDRQNELMQYAIQYGNYFSDELKEIKRTINVEKSLELLTTRLSHLCYYVHDEIAHGNFLVKRKTRLIKTDQLEYPIGIRKGWGGIYIGHCGSKVKRWPEDNYGFRLHFKGAPKDKKTDIYAKLESRRWAKRIGTPEKFVEHLAYAILDDNSEKSRLISYMKDFKTLPQVLIKESNRISFEAMCRMFDALAELSRLPPFPPLPIPGKDYPEY